MLDRMRSAQSSLLYLKSAASSYEFTNWKQNGSPIRLMGKQNWVAFMKNQRIIDTTRRKQLNWCRISQQILTTLIDSDVRTLQQFHWRTETPTILRRQQHSLSADRHSGEHDFSV